MAYVCCTELLYRNEILGNDVVSFVDKTHYRESQGKSCCTRRYLVSFSFLQNAPKHLFSIWINFGSFGVRHVPEILKRERWGVAEWRILAASLSRFVEHWSDPLLNPSNLCLCLSNVKQMSIGLELGLTGGACDTSQDCWYLWSWRCWWRLHLEVNFLSLPVIFKKLWRLVRVIFFLAIKGRD